MIALRTAALAALAAAAAAASSTRPAAAQPCSRLGAPLIDHACFHARHGPFAAVRAGTADHLDAVHTYHRVALDGARATAAAIAYTPARTGDWAFFTQFDVPLELRAPSGAPLPLAHDGPAPGCPHLVRVRVATLAAGTTYRVALGPTPASAVGVVIEKLDDFVAIHGRDGDGDGHGDPAAVLISPCAPPPGYAANDTDCDDADPAVHPGAPERCDDPDRNCNGIAGDDGAPCTAGTGACARSGLAACAAPTAAPSCSATAAPPSVEACNGRDDDCDGVADPGELLCGAPDHPRCVPDGAGAARCGCEIDADCGPPDAARLCLLDGADQRCIDGCVDAPGRAGCPAGLRCTSDDPAAPGTCTGGAPDPAGCGCGAARDASTAALALLLAALALCRAVLIGRRGSR